jgi:phosphoadenosine phosphosulfate reductase
MPIELSNHVTRLASQAVGVLEAAVQAHERVVYSNSLGLESIVLTDLIWMHVPEIRIFTIDTGRLHEETRELLERIESRYRRRMDVYYPQAAAIEAWVSEHGINGFYNSAGERRGCCEIRKVEPFQRAIAGANAWVTGVRREHSAERAQGQVTEWDDRYGLWQLRPLLDWTEQDVWHYVHARGLPYNRLHDEGYPSIGCAPCTRAVAAGEDPRAGRWWWENPDARECGLQPRRKAIPIVVEAANRAGC